jgi:digeranylgeranylglycerophospholipid reductase
MREQVDVLVVGAGPAGSSAARAAAAGGAQVLIVERRRRVGIPVQCAEYVPAQIVRYAPLPERCIGQRIATLRTYLPDGERVETPAGGYVIDRAAFDQALAVAAHRAGARIWTQARALERTADGVLVRRGGEATEVRCRVLIGADGPGSTVGRWAGQENAAYIDARQVEVVLPVPHPSTEVHFHPLYRGGYGWLFPKGDTANVGVGVSRAMGGDPRAALGHLLDRLGLAEGAIIGRTAGRVPTGGEVGALVAGNVLLAGDAAGQTHPITGAGVASAVIGGTLAGEAAARAVKAGDLALLRSYEDEWSTMRGPLRHALAKRRYLDQHWSDDPARLSALLRETWIAFKAYGRPTGQRRRARAQDEG